MDDLITIIAPREDFLALYRALYRQYVTYGDEGRKVIAMMEQIREAIKPSIEELNAKALPND